VARERAYLVAGVGELAAEFARPLPAGEQTTDIEMPISGPSAGTDFERGDLGVGLSTASISSRLKWLKRAVNNPSFISKSPGCLFHTSLEAFESGRDKVTRTIIHCRWCGQPSGESTGTQGCYRSLSVNFSVKAATSQLWKSGQGHERISWWMQL